MQVQEVSDQEEVEGELSSEVLGVTLFELVSELALIANLLYLPLLLIRLILLLLYEACKESVAR